MITYFRDNVHVNVQKEKDFWVVYPSRVNQDGRIYAIHTPLYIEDNVKEDILERVVWDILDNGPLNY